MTAYRAGRTGGSHAEGIEVMIRAALQSPDFLYRLEPPTGAEAGQRMVPLTQYELATRLSYLIWGSGPSDALLDAEWMDASFGSARFVAELIASDGDWRLVDKADSIAVFARAGE